MAVIAALVELRDTRARTGRSPAISIAAAETRAFAYYADTCEAITRDTDRGGPAHSAGAALTWFGMPDPTREIATFAAGCFWCVEAVLERLDGVLDVASGYIGGSVDHPTYEQVCTGTTGHAEAVQVTFDPQRIGYAKLLEWFWQLHDPTTRNRQGGDVGTQYRSAIFVHSPAQRTAATASRDAAQARFAAPIVTEITDAGPFWRADEHHQDFYRRNPRQSYCRAVIAPKMDKLGLAAK